MTKIWIVDAFTDTAYRGNPAAVMIVDEFPLNMLQIAKEMNLSETAFVMPLGGNRFHIRWFTPTAEVKLCGHATLAAAHVLMSTKLILSDSIIFDSLSNELLVNKISDSYSLDFPLQKIGQNISKELYKKALQLNDEILEVVKAFDDVLVLVKDEDIVKELSPDFSRLLEVDARGVIVTTHSSKYDFVSRFFAPKLGVNEDPVTGSAHCKLADYWSKKLNKKELIAYQASERGGVIKILVNDERVILNGKAITILEGKWLVQI
ncbi:PhzF family phenazine biosynthesis isomerase [Silvanigrella paludirubra]|uniref:PhzF family phenazine biosynthesis isomerase n=1 Tax=Silvanigrella paludirubra TaxID=2499159 RepID=A0A6N6VWB9_9BACT|nr:PhzF family phenazine biosynthesis protein [Silvanigrella paludirubra]KAB8040763.1 PhzF family phenazine biosynthesis isomerase [Silvanigrella paludirubra]